MNDLFSLFTIFFRIGLFTFGGGNAVVPLIRQELMARGLMDVSSALDIAAISQITPGPFSINAATFAGMRLAGVPGATVATLGIVTPSIIIMLIISKFFIKLNKLPAIQATLQGIRPVVAALIIVSALFMGETSVFPAGLLSPDWYSLFIAATVFAASRTTKINPTVLILLSAAAGLVPVIYERVV